MDENEKKQETVTLDGKPVSKEQLQEAMGKPGVRLHQENETTYRTLKRLVE